MVTEKMAVMGDQRKVYVEHYQNGKRDTLLLIHGGPGESCITFGRLAEELGAYVDVVLVDQRGVLRSERERDPSKITVRQVVSDFEEIRDQLGLKRWAVLGHSFGGRVALSYAAWHPQSVKAMVLENPAIDIGKALQGVLGRYHRLYGEMAGKYADAGEQAAKLKEALTSGDIQKKMAYMAQVPPRYRCICFGNYVLDQESQALFQYPGFSAEEVDKCGEAMACMVRDRELGRDGYEILKEVNCPVLLFRDVADPMLSEEEAELLRGKGTEVQFQGGGHYLHLKEAKEMSVRIGKFLQGSEGKERQDRKAFTRKGRSSRPGKFLQGREGKEQQDRRILNEG